MPTKSPPEGDHANTVRTSTVTQDEQRDETCNNSDDRNQRRNSKRTGSAATNAQSRGAFLKPAATPGSLGSETAAPEEPTSVKRGADDERMASGDRGHPTEAGPRSEEEEEKGKGKHGTADQSGVTDGVFAGSCDVPCQADRGRGVFAGGQSELEFVVQSVQKRPSRKDQNALGDFNPEQQPLLFCSDGNSGAAGVGTRCTRRLPWAVTAFCLLLIAVCTSYHTAMLLGASHASVVSHGHIVPLLELRRAGGALVSFNDVTSVLTPATWMTVALVMALLTTAAEAVCMATSFFCIFGPPSYRDRAVPSRLDRLCFGVHLSGFAASMGLIFAVVLSTPGPYVSCAFLGAFRLVLLVLSFMVNCSGSERVDIVQV